MYAPIYNDIYTYMVITRMHVHIQTPHVHIRGYFFGHNDIHVHEWVFIYSHIMYYTNTP